MLCQTARLERGGCPAEENARCPNRALWPWDVSDTHPPLPWPLSSSEVRRTRIRGAQRAADKLAGARASTSFEFHVRGWPLLLLASTAPTNAGLTC